ncbi:hypothetical protein F5Y16DRAFT_383898 [Xylariaceae sp. FL0255]|nr:hypothetical protein F5Y16DRAFT_383898 [Xylariaceae sp. FL0255]
MRLRQSNRPTVYVPPSYGLDPDDDIEDADAAPQEPELSEDEFIVDAAPDDLQDEELHSDIEADEDDDNSNNDLSTTHLSKPTNPQSTSKKPRNPKSVRNGVPPESTVGEEVLPYPTDKGQKWTKSYQGPLPRSMRMDKLIDWWYGDTRDSASIVNDFVRIWWPHQLLPPKLISRSRLTKAQSGWMPHDFAQDQRSKYTALYPDRLSQQAKGQVSTIIDKQKAFRSLSPLPQGELCVFLGPAFQQKKHSIQYGESFSFSDTSVPIADSDPDDIVPGGWMLDVGGITVSMAWAPSQGQVDQLLTIAVVPFSDQLYHTKVANIPRESDQQEGAIQILRFESVKDQNGVLRPSRKAPKLAQVLCFSWGRVSRMQWCPVPVTGEDPFRLLGVSCSDGKLRILSVQNTLEKDRNEIFEEFENPLVVFEPPGEYSLEITCFTWINMNRVVAGLSDGSIIVWSISPPRFLQRYAIHSAAIMDIASGYPSDPFLVSTTPVGGFMALTDLRRPGGETTNHPNGMISLQPNLLKWSPHMRGFAAMWPSAFAGNQTVTFLSIKQFPTCRHLLTSNGQPSAIDVGTCHPHMLVGTTDGSLWALSLLHKLSAHKKKTFRLRIFQHEYRPPHLLPKNENGEPRSRGICRILHGFSTELNRHPVGDRNAERAKKKKEAPQRGKKSKSSANSKGKGAAEELAGEIDDDGDGQDVHITSGPGPITVHDPQTRITSIAWNPNVEFSWWAAAAMGSGLLRVMDLGVEPSDQELREDTDDNDDDNANANDQSAMDLAEDGIGDDEEEDDDDDDFAG